jgi:hypothetical protein
MVKSRRRLVLVTVLVGLAVLGGLVALGLASVLRDPFDARPYDTAAWAAAEPEDRAAMARDAIRHLPAGLPEADIEPQLGKGEVWEARQMIGCCPFGTVRTYWYYLGCWSFRYYDATFLWVHVGRTGG